MSDTRFLCLLLPGQKKLAELSLEGKINIGLELRLLPGGLPFKQHTKVG